MKLIFFFICYLFCVPAFGETPPPPACEPIFFAGHSVGCVLQGVGAFSAKERASTIAARIRGLANTPTFDPQTITTEVAGDAVNVVTGDTIIMSIRAGDFLQNGRMDTRTFAETTATEIRDAILTDRKEKSPKALMWATIFSVLTTLGLVAVLAALKWVYPRIHLRVRQLSTRYIRGFRLRSFELINNVRITAFLAWVVSASRVLLTILAFYIYLPLVFSFFPWTANWAPKLFSYIVAPLHTIGVVVVEYIPKFFFVVVITIVTRYLLKFVHFLFTEIEIGVLSIEGFYAEWALPTYKLVRILIVAFAVVMVFPYLPGSSSPAFQGVSVFLGILLSLGSSSAVSNIVAGVVITYMRPFRLGDRVKIADTIGDVTEKSLLVTRIRTIKNVEITIPNSMILGSHIINYSGPAQTDGLILNTTVTIGYDVPWRQVHELLKTAASRTANIDNSRTPFVLQTALNDFFVSYELNAFTSQPNKMAIIYSELHQNIQDCFNEAGVEIMSPHVSRVRDGNEPAIPTSYRKEGAEIPKFKVEVFGKES